MGLAAGFKLSLNVRHLKSVKNTVNKEGQVYSEWRFDDDLQANDDNFAVQVEGHSSLYVYKGSLYSKTGYGGESVLDSGYFLVPYLSNW